jgi:hypothetical protein
MPVYKVFTWNMQRAQSVSRQDATIRQRFRVLRALVNWADFGFITEPGMDIRNRLDAYSNLPNLNGWYYVLALDDNQNNAAACRPVVYSKHGFTGIPLDHKQYARYQSGADTAHRYPALGFVQIPNDGEGHDKLLLVSFHATSGYNAEGNCQDYFDSFYETRGEGQFARNFPLVWIVGGDFNHRGDRPVYMPQAATHQSNHRLDGFFADQYVTNFEVTLTTGPQTYVDGNNPGEGDLIIVGHGNPHGYVVNGLHLSDHCPVTAEFRIDRRSAAMDVDTANILPQGTKRARKSTGKSTPPTKYPKT